MIRAGSESDCKILMSCRYTNFLRTTAQLVYNDYNEWYAITMNGLLSTYYMVCYYMYTTRVPMALPVLETGIMSNQISHSFHDLAETALFQKLAS